jgi:hypothetical protein
MIDGSIIVGDKREGGRRRRLGGEGSAMRIGVAQQLSSKGNEGRPCRRRQSRLSTLLFRGR